jgi:2-keto-3-deoxy-L-rhamnonate aldolase RhmA
MLQIETREAVENVEAIAAVDGVGTHFITTLYFQWTVYEL